MTEVTLHEEGNILTLTMDGHAGDDNVCAACSILSGTICTYIESLPIPKHIVFEGGRTRIILNRTALAPYDLEILHNIKFCMAGFHLLEEQYPDYVRVIEG